MTVPPLPVEVAAVLGRWPAPVRAQLLAVRTLIFETAAATAGVGPLTETLKWSEPAYLTAASRSGSTIRLGRVAGTDDRCAVLFNCRTTLVEHFRAQFADELTFSGNRAILLDRSKPLPSAALATCVVMALTYHRWDKRSSSRHASASQHPASSRSR